MSDEMSENVGANIYESPVVVKHAELERSNNESFFRSVCPVCQEGTLMVKRDSKTYKLVADDHCILCGQQFIYSDIDELRERAGEGLKDESGTSKE